MPDGLLADLRRVVRHADPELVEEWKWLGRPVWTRAGVVCVATPCKDKIKLTFAEGASVPDPDRLFNAGLAGNRWRAIDYFRDDSVREPELARLVRAAVAHNLTKAATKPAARIRTAG